MLRRDISLAEDGSAQSEEFNRPRYVYQGIGRYSPLRLRADSQIYK